MIENVRVTESEILFKLTKQANKKNISLTYGNKLFFLRLINYAKENGEYNKKDGLFVTLSVKGFSEVLNVPLRTVIQSLNRLVACSALKRVEEKKTFPRTPMKTIISKKFYYYEYEKEKTMNIDILIDTFNKDERLIINKSWENTLDLDKFTRENYLRDLIFIRSNINDEDEFFSLYDLYDNLIKKIESLTDEQWEKIKNSRLPLFVPYDTEDTQDLLDIER